MSNQPKSKRAVANCEQPIDRVLRNLKQVSKTSDGWKASCPAHEDRTPSLSVTVGDDDRALLHCFAGCSQEAVIAALRLEKKDLFAAPSNNGHDKSKPPKQTWPTLDAMVAAMLKWSHLRGGADTLYVYSDAFVVWRFDLKDGSKTFYPARREGEKWCLGNPPGKLPLFHIDKALKQETDIYVAEGEGCADTLWSIGLTAVTSAGGSGSVSKSDWSPLANKNVVIIPDHDEPGKKYAEQVAWIIGALQAGTEHTVKILELPDLLPGEDVVNFIKARGDLNIGQLNSQIRLLASDVPPWKPADNDAEHPTILITTKEYEVACETIEALTRDPDTYQRGGALVRVLRDSQPKHDGIVRAQGSATIGILPLADLRERMSRFATFYKYNAAEKLVPARPTSWLVNAVDARGNWPEIRHLLGVSDAPVLRADGSIFQTPGYDPKTCVLYDPTEEFPTIPDDISDDAAVVARDELLDVVSDFRFEAPEHRAAWVASLLTLLARFAFDGPTPMFLADANIRGAGKGLLFQVNAGIALGHPLAVSTYEHRGEELRKAITSIALAGDRAILFDNITGTFGNATLERALTGTRWSDRILGKNETINLPLVPAWFATGNNVVVSPDMVRRIIHIRLDVLEEHPEDRSDFNHPNLLAWVTENRGRLLTNAMTILAAYCRVGRPSQGLTPYGSFEGWSDLVRQAVVWAGLPDPCLTRTRLAESADTTTDALIQLIAAWREYDPAGGGLIISPMLKALYPATREDSPFDDASTAMRDALENLVGCEVGKAPKGTRVGFKLHQFRRRVISGLYLDSDKERGRHGMRWRLHEQKAG